MDDKAVNTIELQDVSIEFPGVKAPQNANCRFDSNRAVAVVGANGAGKSTMMKILSGVNPAYTGTLLFNGEPVKLRSPGDAKKLGIEIIYQEVDTALIPTLSVGENVMIDHLVYGMKGHMFLNWKDIHTEAKKALDKLNLTLDSRTVISSLTLPQKQMVLIARAMYTNCKFLILDEPTAPLSDKETKILFDHLKKLKENGVGIIFISHRLHELYDVCDDITVMCDGKIVDTLPLTKAVTIDNIVNLMLGNQKIGELDKSGIEIGAEVLKVSAFSDSENRVHDIDLSLRAGEIVGLSGLVGAGKTELCKALFGVYGKANGSIEINGKPVFIKTPAHAVNVGIAFMPEERRREGLVVSEQVFSNLSLATLSGLTGFLSFIKKKLEAKKAKAKVDDLRIKTPSINQKVALLSGGNQQKVVIGKWLDSSADIYIFDEPTKGIDIGAKSEVYRLIIELAEKGKAIIFASGEQSEILALTNRAYILYNGMIQKEVITAETNEEELLYYAVGVND
ncbi:MAG: sugar ABC transporter ATP-binding protein [Oscillospiraceae bacterium]|nr:sugar ABC transporter ATP-binding protein [Oscillospiraceae bacterium]